MSERSAHREVLNQARRKVERALAVEGASEALAAAADQLLLSAGEAESPEQVALRAALDRYRRMRGG